MLAAFAGGSEMSCAWGRPFFHTDLGSIPRDSFLPSHGAFSGLKRHRARTDSRLETLYIEDTAEAFAAILDSNISGPVNIGSCVPVKITDVTWRIGAKLGRTDLIRLGALPTPSWEAPLLVANMGRLSAELG